MKLGGRIPVEPLDDERLTQIERRIVAGAADRLADPVHAPRRLLGFAAGALALAAAVLVGWRLRGPHQAPIAAREAPQTFALHTTGQRAAVDLDGATIASDPASDVEVTRAAGRIDIAMKRGRIELAVVHRADRLVVVHAGDTDVEDVGTHFAVAYDGARAVDVRVTEGTVAVHHDGKRVEIGAGYAWTTERGLVALADLEATGAGAVAAAAPIRAPVDHGKPAVAAAVVPAAPQGVVAHPARPARPAHEPAAVVAVARHPSTASDPYVDLKIAILHQPIALDPRLDGPRDAAAEVARLKPVAYAPQKYGDEASLALYKIAVLLEKPLHQHAEALRTLDLYERRFPRGKELGPALWLRVRIACSHVIDDECRKAAYSYQQHITSGAAADVAIRITNAQ